MGRFGRGRISVVLWDEVAEFLWEIWIHPVEKFTVGLEEIARRKDMSEAVKNDKGKTDWSLLPVKAMDEVMKVFTYGAKQPGREKNQWRYGTWFSRYWNPAFRHLVAYWRGEDFDPESGLHHLAHAACTILMLLEMQPLKLYDDRENWLGQKGPVHIQNRMHKFEAMFTGHCNWCGQEEKHMVHLTEADIQEDKAQKAGTY